MQASVRDNRERRWAIAGAFLIVLTTVVAYGPAIHGGYIWDDREYVWDNSALRSLGGLWSIWAAPKIIGIYCPLTVSTFWLEYHLWGAAPLGYHITNVVLHIVNSLLVWVLLHRLAIPGAFLAAAIFALHPVHVESVAWVTERKDVLSAMFYLLTLLAWLRFVERRRWRSYAAALALFLCAMLSKPTTCTLPLIFLLLAWWKEPSAWRRAIPLVLPFLVVGLGLALVTVWKHRLDNPPVGPTTSLLASWVDKALIGGRAAWFYAGKLLWPANLMAIYPEWRIDSAALWQYAFPAAIIVVLAVLWRYRARIGRLPLVAVLYFLITLGPTVGLVDFGYMRFSWYVADHYQYLPSIGLIALFAALVTKAGERFTLSPATVSLAVAIPLSLVLGLLTWQQGEIYRTEEGFWRIAVAKNPRAWMGQYNLGTLLMEQDKPDEAAAYLEAALRINPDYGQAHKNLGAILARQGKLDDAVAHFVEVVRLQPDSADGQSNWGLALAMQGKLDEAIQHYRAALQIDPLHMMAHYNWGRILELQGALDEAIAQYTAAVRINPEHVEARQSLQRALARRAAVQRQ